LIAGTSLVRARRIRTCSPGLAGLISGMRRTILNGPPGRV
jgi:hypothetical protein